MSDQKKQTQKKRRVPTFKDNSAKRAARHAKRLDEANDKLVNKGAARRSRRAHMNFDPVNPLQSKIQAPFGKYARNTSIQQFIEDCDSAALKGFR